MSVLCKKIFQTLITSILKFFLVVLFKLWHFIHIKHVHIFFWLDDIIFSTLNSNSQNFLKLKKLFNINFL